MAEPADRADLISALVDELGPPAFSRRAEVEEFLAYCEQDFCLKTAIVPPGAGSQSSSQCRPPP
jgi:hypothetical protein